ncbi:hypothetical protein B0181_10630 [Moraxella caviae]|uniref:Protein of uncharacterized function (DUF459) n=1 Tax=Moraxella caviae TaxID=34060 RepID=A0A1S9ZV27_9GAMM|nr:DUF459 domain-containing protein [Moraxella caviae]OOR87243.1 hypothetical protein B0181_10630 [Moraxella caviae]STZ14823.1 Protein of uncharacterised function (DUF459) [Moraxella caviae]VEW11284.1 Protein of uncharacterised function (DUF459) [Moraxella caviae]
MQTENKFSQIDQEPTPSHVSLDLQSATDESVAHDAGTKKAVMVSFVFLLLSALIGIWVMQKSVNAYFMQTYHRPSPLQAVQNPLWRFGEEVGNFLYQQHETLSNYIITANGNVVATFNEYYAYTPEYKVIMEEKARLEAIRLAEQREQQRLQAIENQKQADLVRLLTVRKDQKVFFAGDSMMQGIAPHMKKYLQGLGVQSIDLSKQSTGLSYPSFFNWNRTIKETLEADSSIKVLIVMLGPNDPWDMPGKGGAYLKFQTPEWDQEYQSRMADILEFAKAKDVGVIWVMPPNMKKAKLNEQMIYLNTVMNGELERHTVKVIDSRPIMGGVDDVYSDYLQKDGKQIKMRSGDGIHFSIDGQKILAAEVQSHLIIE